MSLGTLLKWASNRKTPSPPPIAVECPKRFSGPLEPNEAYSDAQSPGQIVREGRYALLLDRNAPQPVEENTATSAWAALEEDMALVPAGKITLGSLNMAEYEDGDVLPGSAVRRIVSVEAFYLDRYAVTNRDFLRFVTAGGYDRMDLWPEEIWPSVLQFVDKTGLPGPRNWSQGRLPRGQENNPVVGVSWYEAWAYARWAGKRLPSAAEWEKAGSWPADLAGRGPKTRYPWGNAFDAARANTWISGVGATVPVHAHPNGCTPNGIYQLIGNVWEWLQDSYDGPTARPGLRVFLEQPMREVRGGAFDTYFEVQATCHFQTGQPALSRMPNLGFRCAVSVDALRPRS